MGGSIAVTLREPDGTEHRMVRWTNSLPWFVKNMKFVNKEKSHIDEYMKQYNQMMADWKANKETKNFVYNMTEVYAPFPGTLAPAGYGLVVIDMKKNIILSMQMYCQFIDIHGAEVNLAIYQKEDGLPASEIDDAYERVKEFMEAGRGVPIYLSEEKKWGVKSKIVRKKHPEKTFEDFIKDLKEERSKPLGKNKNRPWSVEVDLSPFTIKEFNGDDPIEETKRLKQEVLNLGFKLTKDEEKEWDAYIKELNEFE